MVQKLFSMRPGILTRAERKETTDIVWIEHSAISLLQSEMVIIGHYNDISRQCRSKSISNPFMCIGLSVWRTAAR